jgi:tripartite-type tricarboxylate transporter receptor subunit TctC
MKRLLVTCQVPLAAVAVSTAAAVDYLDHPVRLIVPFAPGGPTDGMARHLGNALRDHLGQPIILDNRAAAGGNVGAEAVAKAAPMAIRCCSARRDRLPSTLASIPSSTTIRWRASIRSS